jgi:hypothetical protein
MVLNDKKKKKEGRTRHTTSFRKLVLIVLFHFHFSSGFSGKRKIGASGVVFVSVFFKFLLFRFDRDVVRIDYDYFIFAFFWLRISSFLLQQVLRHNFGCLRAISWVLRYIFYFFWRGIVGQVT